MKTVFQAWISVELVEALEQRAKERGISRSTAVTEAFAAYCNRPDLSQCDGFAARAAVSNRAKEFLKENPHLSIRATVEALAKQGTPRATGWVWEHRQRLKRASDTQAAYQLLTT